MSGRRARRAKDKLAANVVRLRHRREMKQTELAMRARVTQALVSAIELAKANPTVESLYRIAQALGVEIEDLFVAVQE
jgi:transcriptional regulator with XRE-family HTH domain